jgi:hypothetical protein
MSGVSLAAGTEQDSILTSPKRDPETRKRYANDLRPSSSCFGAFL